jgi:hypothetical protein
MEVVEQELPMEVFVPRMDVTEEVEVVEVLEQTGQLVLEAVVEELGFQDNGLDKVAQVVS